ncbi:putative 2-aminoethylphosphonate ABC transporter ATP-binding protein [uncultured Shimia sp.]|uniref:putative 2-aminoethylphosphonate ABC transporter ATP-binding protein n=1 Tax=uncultured Shimia sp. TaxID=573152 RepID=UPI00261725C6|nr:putative 2-aminoethylphosphonate ABC transporter ATP-binding protein [uncultured Shimia sp.]
MTTPDPKTHLDLRALTKRFRSFTALSEISLTVDEGEFLCFVGPSGCGKTTLLRLIAGLETPDAGHVQQQGRNVTALPPAERNYGIVFQSYALFPNLTVARNVAYGLEGKGLSRAEISDRVTEMLALVGLPDQADKYPAQISGGQQQRVALARALAPEPGLLLLDEPLSALDAKERERLRREIREVQSRLGLTTVMVTHDQDEALQMADRIVVMNAGQIEQIGSPTEIYQRPATRFVAEFIGEANWMTGTYHGDDQFQFGDIRVSCQPGAVTPGQTAEIAVRPEDLHVETLKALEAGTIAIVTSLRFRGSFTQCHLTLKDGATSLVAHVPLGRAEELQLSEGSEVSVSIQPHRAVVFPKG